MKARLATIAMTAALLSIAPLPAGAVPKDLSREKAVEVSDWQDRQDSAKAEAAYNLGVKYQTGTGNANKDPAIAAGWFRRAAERGHARAQYELANALDKGLGVKKNYKEALKWYTVAAAQGSPQAKAGLGGLYEKGRGAKRDYKQAAKWYREAAEQGVPEAQLGLGILYKDGRGVERDYAEAYFWLALAVKTLDAAMDPRDETGTHLDPAGLKAARDRAAGWKPLIAPEISP